MEKLPDCYCQTGPSTRRPLKGMMLSLGKTTSTFKYSDTFIVHPFFNHHVDPRVNHRLYPPLLDLACTSLLVENSSPFSFLAIFHRVESMSFFSSLYFIEWSQCIFSFNFISYLSSYWIYGIFNFENRVDMHFLLIDTVLTVIRISGWLCSRLI